MENYRKIVKSTEKEAEDELANMRLELDPSLVLDANVVHMNVKIGSKVANLMAFASNKFEVCTQSCFDEVASCCRRHLKVCNSLLFFSHSEIERGTKADHVERFG